MNKKNILRLNDALNLFNYDSAPIDLVLKMMKNKIAIEDAVERISRQLSKISATLKPSNLEELKAELQAQLSQERVDDKMVLNLQSRIKIVSQIWNNRYSEAEKDILMEEEPISIELLTLDELYLLLRPKKDIIDTGGKKEIVAQNRLSSEHLSALSYITNINS